ncbi:MAG: BACON domain-containing protein [Candidatus Cryptobacteroides sp.]
MKIVSKLIVAVLAIAGTCVSCQLGTGLDGSNLSLDPESVVEVGAAQQEVTVAVTADCNWVASCDADWVKLSVESGKGDGEVVLYVDANAGAAREAIVHFQKSTTRKVSADLTVKQATGLDLKPGDGTKENPYLASQAANICAELESGATTSDKVYVKGYIKKLASGHESAVSDYGNGKFYITDDPEGQVTPDFYCFQVYYLGNVKFTSADQVKVGDEVVVYGQLTNYNGTYETVGRGAAYIYSLNGETESEPAGEVDTDKISEVVASKDGSEVTLNNVTVMATTTKSFLVKDAADDYLFVYGTADCKEGDVITVKGSRATYSNMPQLTSPAVTKSSTTTVTHPAPEDITSSFDSFSSSTVKYVSYVGTLVQSGNYYNVNVDGATTNTGSILYPVQDLSAFISVPGVTYTGYYVYTSGGKYINIVLTDVKAGNSPYLTVSPATVSVLATATETEISVNSNTSWTAACDNAAFTLDKTQGENSATVKVTFAANEESTEKKATVTFTYDGGKTAAVSITQKAAGAAGTPVYTLDTSKEGTVGPNNGYNNQGSLEIDGITWTCQGNMKPDQNGLPKPWRVGGKEITDVDRALYTETPMSSAISKITFTPGTVGITLNSAKLVYSTDKDFSNAVEKEFTVTASTPVDIVADFPANAYYKFVFNVTNSTKTNKYVEIAKIEFYAAQ